MSERSDPQRLPSWLSIIAALLVSLVCLVLYTQFKLQMALTLTGGMLVLALALFRPSIALALLCAMLPFEGIASPELQMTEVHLAGMATFAIWIAYLLLHGKRIRIDRTFLFGAALVVWAGISLLWARGPDEVGVPYFTLVQSLLLFLLCINVVESEADFRIVMAGFLLGALVSSPWSLTVFVQNVVERARVFEAQNPNGYSMVIGFSILAGLYLIRSLKDIRIRAILLLTTLFLIVPLILAQSRSGWLATASAVAVMIWYTRHRLRNFLLLLAVIVGIVGGLFATGMVNFTLVDRAYNLITMRDQGSRRLDVWRVAGNMIAAEPVLGVGFHQFPNRYNQFRPQTPSIRLDQVPGRDPHNTFVAVQAELGIVGMALLLLMLWNACREEKVPTGRHPWISDTMVAYVMVFSMGGTMLPLKMFWVALALAAKARYLATETNENPELGG